ncbi:hypothetical protein SAMN05660461_1838 [Chitinophaga ginsengisegetis]|jgi:hypothetical protein
MVD